MPRRVGDRRRPEAARDDRRRALAATPASRSAQADVFVNVAGGVRIDEPGADLAVALAIASAATGVAVRDGARRVRRDRPHRPAAAGDAGRAAARGVREARAAPRSSSRPAPTARGKLRVLEAETLRHAIEAGLDADRGQTRRDRTRAPSGVHARAAEDDPRRDPKLLAAIARIAPGTRAAAGHRRHHPLARGRADRDRRARETLAFLYSGGMRLDQPFTPQLLYELAKMDGAIIVNDDAVEARVRERPADAGPDDRVATRPARGTAPPSASRSRRARSSSRSRSSARR